MLDRSNACGHRRKQERPRELLDAARDLFVEKGFAAARAEDIAARAGVSKATLYLYFRSKEDLLETLIAQRFASRIAIGAHETDDARASQDVLRDVLTTWQSALMEAHAGGIFKLVLTEVRNFPGLADFWSREVIEPARRVVSSIVVRGIDRGEFRPVDPDLVVHALVLPILIMCLHRDAMGPSAPADPLMNAPDVFSRHFDLVLQGLT
jgi:AcrR family transcriptional regulator